MALGTTRAVALVAAAAAVVFAVILTVAGPLTETSFTSVSYAALSATAGIVLVAAALSNRGRSRVAWALIGTGVLCWGIGEIVWIAQGAAGEIPYPGPADFFYVAGYPLLFAGIILLPHLRPGHFERIRLAIDALAGTVSLGVVMWVAYLHQVVRVGSNPIETFLNLLYPFGDVLLATALMVLAMRRTEQRLDLRIVFLAAAVALTTAADVIFSLQVAAETYVDWGWLDALWLFSYGSLSFTAWLVTKPTQPSEHTYRAVRGWQLIAPYAAVTALFLTRLLTSTGSSLILNLATTGVAGLVIGRQGIALRERRELLERQRDDLVASVSHELRTPLTGIQGYSQISLEAGDILSPAERREMVETIGTQTTHLGRIVTDLIDVARDRLQNTRLHRSDYGAAELVRKAVAAAAGGRQVATELDEEARVFADTDRIRQVLVNLITNAVRYGRSKITVVTRIDNGADVFSVHDGGDGVPNKYQHTIFERFERGAHKFDSAVGGSGIGLSVGRDLVTAHGGEIRYRPSDLSGGACFEFTLPATQPSLPDLVGV